VVVLLDDALADGDLPGDRLVALAGLELDERRPQVIPGAHLDGRPSACWSVTTSLRRKIEPAGGAWRYIRTDAGVGYRFGV